VLKSKTRNTYKRQENGGHNEIGISRKLSDRETHDYRVSFAYYYR